MILRIGKNNNLGSRVSGLGSGRAPSTKHRAPGFTLVEVFIAVAVIAVGMVFILGAFSQCMSALTTAQKMTTANYLLNVKMWEIDLNHTANDGSEEGEWEGAFDAPYQDFNWTHVVRGVSADFGNETFFIQQDLNEELFKVAWRQGKTIKDVSVVRYVKKKKEI